MQLLDFQRFVFVLLDISHRFVPMFEKLSRLIHITCVWLSTMMMETADFQEHWRLKGI